MSDGYVAWNGSQWNSVTTNSNTWHNYQGYAQPMYYASSIGLGEIRSNLDNYIRPYQWTVTVNSPRILNKNIKIL